jgi:hypothetical protein
MGRRLAKTVGWYQETKIGSIISEAAHIVIITKKHTARV